MSKVIRAAIWEEKPCLIEVPPVLIEAVPPIVETKEKPEEPKESTFSEKKYAYYLQIKAEAEQQKLEAENMLAAVKREQEDLLNKMAGKLQAMQQDAEAKAMELRQKAESELVSARNEAEEVRRKADEAAMLVRAEAEEAKQKIISDANTEAADLKVRTTEVAKTEGFEQGHREGLERGYREGTEKALSEQKQAILEANAKAEKTLRDAEQEKNSYFQESETEIAGLVLQIVTKILPQHFIDMPQVILPLVRKALLKIKDQNHIFVHVAPMYYDLVLLAKNELQASLEGNAVLEVTSDASLGVGDVFLESPNGEVDARLETQLELVRKAIQDVIA